MVIHKKGMLETYLKLKKGTNSLKLPHVLKGSFLIIGQSSFEHTNMTKITFEKISLKKMLIQTNIKEEPKKILFKKGKERA